MLVAHLPLEALMFAPAGIALAVAWVRERRVAASDRRRDQQSGTDHPATDEVTT